MKKKYIAKLLASALLFGTVSGAAFTGVSYAGHQMTASQATESTAADTSASDNISLTATSTAASSSATSVTDVSDIAAECLPSIVAITCVSQSEYYSMFGQVESYDSESCGSGIIIAEDDDSLYIATNNHVVSGATSLTITFSDDSTAAATIKGTDASNDLAVVQVAKSDLSDDTANTIKIATLGDSDSMAVGASCVAIGNALGYGQSVTTGVISALNREVTSTDSSTGESVTNSLIQTDAAINPGNSGGALINMNGEVIGINSAKYSDTSVEGMGYAIPINTAKTILEKLINEEEIPASQAAYLGVAAVTVNSDMSNAYNIPEGAYVAQVTSQSAAESAGIQSGDVITAFDGSEVSSADDLSALIANYSAGTTVPVTLYRSSNGEYQEMTISVTLGLKADSDSSGNSDNSDNANNGYDQYGYGFFGNQQGSGYYGNEQGQGGASNASYYGNLF